VAGVFVAADLARIKNTALLAIGREAEPAANFWAVSFFSKGHRVAYKIDEVVDFDSLTCVAHAMAVDKGWWEGERSAVECWVNFHAELSEALEEYRCGRMATWYAADAASVLRSGGVPKPEGFWVEVADLMIRIADYVGSRRFNASRFSEVDYDDAKWNEIPSVIFLLHWHVSAAEFRVVVEACEKFAAAHKVDLYAIIREKLRYNATRPHRHGGKRA